MLGGPDTDMLSWLLLIGPLSVPLVAAVVCWVASRTMNVEDRIMVDGRRSLAFGFVAIFVLFGGLAEWALGADLAVITPNIVAAYPDEFARWIGRVAGFSLAAGVFTGLGAYGVTAWWFGPRKAASIHLDGRR